MNIENHYKPPEKSNWQGRESASIQLIDLNNAFPDSQNYALLGFCCDQGVKRNHGRIGAALGPQSFRQELAALPALSNLCDCGDITCLDDDLESAQKALGEMVAELLKRKIKPILIGGGHEIAWGHYQGIAKSYPNNSLGIINFDAHFDMRPLIDGKYGSSGTSFRQIAEERKRQGLNFDYTCIGIQKSANSSELFDATNEYNVNYVLAEEIFYNSNQHCFSVLDDALNRDHEIYLSLCMDVFSSTYAPGVSATSPLGLTPWQVIQMLRYIKQSGKIISFDVAELAPNLDNNKITAKLASRIVWEYLNI